MMRKKKKPCDEFLSAVARLRIRRHTRMPRGYRKDPTDYNIIELMPIPSCENCKSPFKKDREVTIGGYTRIDNACKQRGVCPEWTPFPQETEGSINGETED